MIAKAFEFAGRGHLELNLSIGEALRLVGLLGQIKANTVEEKILLTRLLRAIEKGWGFD